MGSGGSDNSNPIWRKFLPWFLAVLFVFFFIGGPDYHSARHFKAFWNLGHILFFALLLIPLFSYRRKWPSGRFLNQSLIVLGICLFLGVLIELLQSDFQRTPDAGDVFRDMIGGLVGICFFLGSRKSLRAKVLATFQVIAIGLVGLQVYPVLTALADEYLAYRQFPVLSGFENPWEISRWVGNAAFSIDSNFYQSGNCSLRVQLGTEQYSGIFLKYFPSDWQGARSFRFSVFNPSQQALSLTCRINDQQHEKGQQRYSDRFNRRYELPWGWTTIDINVKDIRNAPEGRQMDMRHISEVGMFAVKLPQPRVIYIDDVRVVY